MANTLLKIEHLTKSYDGNVILKDFNLSVRKGEVIVIIGPSGCGKSTLLRCINGLEPIQSGVIKLDDEIIDSKSKTITKLRQRVGMVFQSYDLFPHKTVLQNIILAPTLVQKRDVTKKRLPPKPNSFLTRSDFQIKKTAIRDSFQADKNSVLQSSGRCVCTRR